MQIPSGRRVAARGTQTGVKPHAQENYLEASHSVHAPNVRTVATTKQGRVAQTSEAPCSTMLSSSVVGEGEGEKEVGGKEGFGHDAVGQVQEIMTWEDPRGAATVAAGSNVAAQGHATVQVPALVIEEKGGDAVERVERWLCASRGCATRGSELRKANTLDTALTAVAHVAFMWSSAANDHYDQRRWWRQGGEDACLSLPSSLSLRREGGGEGGEVYERPQDLSQALRVWRGEDSLTKRDNKQYTACGTGAPFM